MSCGVMKIKYNLEVECLKLCGAMLSLASLLLRLSGGLTSLADEDAFVPQPSLVIVKLYNKQYYIRRNLPGQRQGARSWYWYFRDCVSATLGFSWCVEQPCLAKCVVDGVCNCFMTHVDDLLFTGSKEFWNKCVLPAMTSKFNVSFNEIQGEGTSISFLKRKLLMMSDGLMLVPGTTVEKITPCFEQHFGPARAQKIPCDSAIQNEDKSQLLNAVDCKAYRSVIGLLFYVSRDRADVMYAVKELASCMSAPSLCALQKLRKLIGYLKFSGDVGMRLFFPEHGAGKCKKGLENFWLIETFTDADWSSSKKHRKSTFCAIHLVNCNYAYGSS
eukprot:s907_g18.t1